MGSTGGRANALAAGQMREARARVTSGRGMKTGVLPLRPLCDLRRSGGGHSAGQRTDLRIGRYGAQKQRCRTAKRPSRRTAVAKGQMRSNKEARKPKKAKVKTIAAAPSQKGGPRGLENLKND